MKTKAILKEKKGSVEERLKSVLDDLRNGKIIRLR